MTNQTNNSQPINAMMVVENYTPKEIAQLIESRGVVKATAPVLTTLALSVLAGAFIAFGGIFSTVIGTSSLLGFGPTKLVTGLAFSVGLILVVIAGAELFTGNNLIVMSWVSRNITLRQLLRNWGLVFIGNLVGALSIVFMVYISRWWAQDSYEVGGNALAIANSKVNLSFTVIFFRGILANALVCLAVWLAASGRTLVGKVLAIVFPITAFVAAGFEHSIANMYFLPMGLLLVDKPEVLQAAGVTAGQVSNLTIGWSCNNLIAATLGNIVGGGLMVGLVYWFIYCRPGCSKVFARKPEPEAQADIVPPSR